VHRYPYQVILIWNHLHCLSHSDIGFPAVALNLFDTLAIVLLVPVFDRILYPNLKAKGIKLTMLKKIGRSLSDGPLSLVVTKLGMHPQVWDSCAPL
jgi:dipeptide/tripeptide permease